MKKIPYALTLLVAYIIMTYRNFSVAFGEAGNFALVVTALVPVVLALMLIVNMKKDISQIAAIVCLAWGAAYLYSACSQFAGMMSLIRHEGVVEYMIAAMLPNLLNAAFGGFIAWFVGARIQDGETSGNYKLLAVIAFLAQLLVGFMPISTGYGNVPVSSLGNLVLIVAFWHLPNAFVNTYTAKKTKVKHIVILAILVVFSIAGEQILMNMR